MSNKRRNFRMTFLVVTVLLIAGSLLVTNILSDFSGARLDMTSDKIYTMSPAAADILSNLKVPVQVKFYITGADEMPTELKTLERDVTDKLRDYNRASGGMLQFSIHDPQNDEEMQTALAGRGLRPFQVQSIDKDEIGVKMIWSTMTIAYKDYPEEIIPQVLPQSLMTMEYDLISRMYRLTREKNPKVALIAPLQEVDPQVAMMYMQQGMQPPEPQELYANVTQMLQQEYYDVERVELTPTSRIPEDADLMIVLGPVNFDERQAFEINRAMSNGLNTIIAIQRHLYDYQPGERSGFTINAKGQDSGLEAMLGAIGVSVGNDHYCDESHQVLSVPRTQNLGGLRFQTNEPIRLPIQVLVTESQMNTDSAITNRIANLLYLWGSTLEINDSVLAENNLTADPLFSSSNRSWREPFRDGVVPGSTFHSGGKDIESGLPLAVRLTGMIPDTYIGRETPEWAAQAGEDAEQPQPDMIPPLVQEESSLIVVGSSTMFTDMAIQAGQNSLLLLNMVDALAHGEDLISIRSKILTQRTIRPVSDNEKLMLRLFVVILVPLLLAIVGVTRAARRKKEAVR